MEEPGFEGRVVVADDDEHTRFLLQEVLEGWGFQVAQAENGEQALRVLEGGAQLLVLDLMMPKVDGFAVLRRLRASPTLADLPVIVLTAIGDVEGKLKGIELGADDYVTKPFRLKDLQQRVRRVLDKQRYRRFLRGDSSLGAPPPASAQDGQGQEAADCFGQLRDNLHGQVGQARRSGTPLSALLVALESPPAGLQQDDRPVIEQAQGQLVKLMKSHFREADHIHRLDGETLLVLMPDTSRSAAARAAERLLRVVQERPLASTPLNVCVGVAEYAPQGSAKPDDLVRAALGALLTARRNGTAGVQVADGPPSQD